MVTRTITVAVDWPDESVVWLECLVSAYEEEHDWSADEDASATSEMIGRCKLLIGQLRGKLPAPESDE